MITERIYKRSLEVRGKIGRATYERWRDPIYAQNIRDKMLRRHVREETKARLKEKSKLRFGTTQSRDEVSLKQGGTLVLCRPLLLRGATSKECSVITGKSVVAIENVLTRLRHRPGILTYPTPRETRVAQARSHTGICAKELTSSDLFSLTFTQRLKENGLCTDDLAYWNKLHSLYQKNNRDLPPHFVDRLRLEAFFRARFSFNEGDEHLMAEYRRIGESIDEEWFYSSLLEEQKFIISQTTRRMNGNEKIGIEYARFDRARDFYLENGVRWGE